MALELYFGIGNKRGNLNTILKNFKLIEFLTQPHGITYNNLGYLNIGNSSIIKEFNHLLAIYAQASNH